MLVLSRKTNDSILIGDDITIKVIEVRGSGVRIGIEAPKEVGIMRSELLIDAPAAMTEKTSRLSAVTEQAVFTGTAGI